jgi:hypothetical protein
MRPRVKSARARRNGGLIVAGRIARILVDALWSSLAVWMHAYASSALCDNGFKAVK